MNRKRSINAESMSICQVDHLVYVLEFLESLLLAGHEIMGAARHKTKLFERLECEEHQVSKTSRLLNFSSVCFGLGNSEVSEQQCLFYDADICLVCLF